MAHFFAYIAVMFGAGRNGKRGLLSQKWQKSDNNDSDRAREFELASLS